MHKEKCLELFTVLSRSLCGNVNMFIEADWDRRVFVLCVFKAAAANKMSNRIYRKLENVLYN